LPYCDNKQTLKAVKTAQNSFKGWKLINKPCDEIKRGLKYRFLWVYRAR